MSFFKDFKAFAVRGNALDLAVAVIIGAAFGKIVTSLVSGIIMPIVGLLLGGINIADKSISIGQAKVMWGLFLQNIIDFTIIAFAIFVFIRLINKLKAKHEKSPKLTTEEKLLTEIRDLLANPDKSSNQ